jgi:hypothetical protein
VQLLDPDDIEKFSATHVEMGAYIVFESVASLLHLGIEDARDLESMMFNTVFQTGCFRRLHTSGMHPPQPVPALVFDLRSGMVKQWPSLTHFTIFSLRTFC